MQNANASERVRILPSCLFLFIFHQTQLQNARKAAAITSKAGDIHNEKRPRLRRGGCGLRLYIIHHAGAASLHSPRRARVHSGEIKGGRSWRPKASDPLMRSDLLATV